MLERLSIPEPLTRWPAALVSAAVLLVATPARAAWPDDVTLSALATWNGQSVGERTRQGAYETVIKELAVGIANKPMAPAETTGPAGFDVSFSSTVGFIDATSDDPTNPAPWQRVHEDGDPTGVLWVPRLSASKGLPLSLEVGGNLGYVAFSRQAVFGAWGRWALVEGYRQFPDFSVRVGYSGYVGNEELELGVTDASASLGYTLPFGTLVGINEARFSPWLGVGMLHIRALPRMSDTDMARYGVYPINTSDAQVNQGFSPVELHLGFRIHTGDFQVLMLGTYVPGVMPTANMGFGYVF